MTVLHIPLAVCGDESSRAVLVSKKCLQLPLLVKFYLKRMCLEKHCQRLLQFSKEVLMVFESKMTKGLGTWKQSQSLFREGGGRG